MYLRGSIAIIVLALVALLFFLSHRVLTPEAATIGNNVSSFDELKSRFQDLARRRGGEYAFEVLKTAQLPPNTDLHLLGHAVGDILYKQKGVEGIADCTQDFRNACSHAIVVGALNDFGEGALPKIHDACKKAPGGEGAYTMCYHGLGHGVFAYFGYDLPQTIRLCAKTGTADYHDREYVECVGGSIMELMGGGGHDHDKWLAARDKYLTSPLSPCMSPLMPDATKDICLTYLTPRLWELAGINIGNPDPSQFKTAFNYCAAIPESQKDLRQTCYGGFGKEFYPLVAARDTRDGVLYSDEQLRTVVSWCKEAGNIDGESACVGDAVSSAFWGGEKDPDPAFRLCGEVTDSTVKKHCYERLAGEIDSFVHDARRAGLCARIPSTQRGICARSS